MWPIKVSIVINISCENLICLQNKALVSLYVYVCGPSGILETTDMLTGRTMITHAFRLTPFSWLPIVLARPIKFTSNNISFSPWKILVRWLFAFPFLVIWVAISHVYAIVHYFVRGVKKNPVRFSEKKRQKNGKKIQKILKDPRNYKKSEIFPKKSQIL